jgi:hypothetical protein
MKKPMNANFTFFFKNNLVILLYFFKKKLLNASLIFYFCFYEQLNAKKKSVKNYLAQANLTMTCVLCENNCIISDD